MTASLTSRNAKARSHSDYNFFVPGKCCSVRLRFGVWASLAPSFDDLLFGGNHTFPTQIHPGQQPTCCNWSWNQTMSQVLQRSKTAVLANLCVRPCSTATHQSARSGPNHSTSDASYCLHETFWYDEGQCHPIADNVLVKHAKQQFNALKSSIIALQTVFRSFTHH